MISKPRTFFLKDNVFVCTDYLSKMYFKNELSLKKELPRKVKQSYVKKKYSKCFFYGIGVWLLKFQLISKELSVKKYM